ncbi:DUF771 domain-containing protein [Paenibacillus sp. Lou8.1]|uniref:DUF771 domain-containing protein n=1 Tax=Paenibacillus TaxID=44249 RepID=UPI00202424CC|nr:MULTISPECIES: DUF771 domain-containing protein [Paenibacillus]MCP3806456.1 DUF771 domain-containing protein [Paenibacillus sp. Lou8.1]URJ42277.1 DUF771 domain-containing protein [Paenibacillus polymyxa]
MESQAFKVVVDPEFIYQLVEKEIKKALEGFESGSWWDMKRLEFETCRKRDWLLENILLNPNYKQEMSQITNGCEGGRWMIRAQEMKAFLDKYFHHLNRPKHRNVSNKKGETV